MVRDIMNLSSAGRDRSPFIEEIIISEDRPAPLGFITYHPNGRKWILSSDTAWIFRIAIWWEQWRGVVKIESTCSHPPVMVKQPKYQRLEVNLFPQPTFLGSTFTIIPNQLILTTEERKVPKSKTWDLIQSTPLVTCQSPKQRWKCYQTHPIKHRTASFQDKIYDQDLPAYPRAEA